MLLSPLSYVDVVHFTCGSPVNYSSAEVGKKKKVGKKVGRMIFQKNEEQKKKVGKKVGKSKTIKCSTKKKVGIFSAGKKKMSTC